MAKVAVVAVHGVADQKPGESARAIADLLCADPQYGSFTEVPLRVARERMEPGPLPAGADPGLQYMHEQLQGYPQPGVDAGAVYDTVRLEGRRSDGTDVHVHEVYWADLSRAGETWYRLLAEFYQLILHLPSLGRNGLRYAAKENGGWWWTAAHAVQRFTVGMLTIPAVILNVVLLSLGLVTMSAEIPPKYQLAAAVAIASVVFAGAAIAALRALRLRKVIWATWPLILGGSVAAAYALVRPMNLFKVLALEATLVAAVTCIYIASKYAVLKPKAKPFGIAAAVVMAVIAVSFIWTGVADEASAYVAAVETAQRLYPALVITWLLIFGGAVVAAITGIIAAMRTPKEERRAAWRAIWTARFSLAMPATLFTVFTLSIWYLVILGIGKLAPATAKLDWWPGAFLFAGEAKTGVAAAQLMKDLLFDSTRGLEVFVGALAVFLLFALVAVLPSLLVEIKPPRTSTEEESKSLGTWLSGGIKVVAVAAEVFTVALVLMLLLNVVPPAYKFTADELARLLGGSALVVAAILTSKRFIKTFRAAVDVLLDVDNYLRESPRDATPRAKIAERFASLLRHLSASGYGKVVIVAHSQGTVIAADVLRYLIAVPDRRINVPIRLFTLGLPLRPLYAAAFPSLYSWIETPESALAVTPPATIADDAPPVPRSVNVQVWANAYRSGDYVGRHLWLDEKYARLWVRDPERARDAAPTRVQFCIGAGAHTHYWNRYGGDVGRFLCTLID